MGVDVQIAIRLDLQVDEAMAGNLVQHVLQEGYPRLEPGLAATVEIEPHANPRFQGMALNLGAAGGKGLCHGACGIVAGGEE